MNRRIAITATLAALVATPAVAQNRTNGDVLRDLIETVIASGDTSTLGEYVTSDVAIADYGVSGIDAFREVSDTGHQGRQTQYDDYSFEIVSIAESDEWAHALVRFTGDGESRSVFYAARFSDGLISELYL
jgi:hypothetical protein